MKFYPGIIVLILCISACAKRPYADSNKKYKTQSAAFARILRSQPTDSIVADSLKTPAYWIGTTNFGMRRPSYVIIHHTAQQSCEQTLQTFAQERTQVSAHYVICNDGTLYHILNDYLRAWHAGLAKWGNETDINSCSLGIELDNNGSTRFSEAQLNTLLGLLASLKKKYNIPAANFIGHADVAPGRKTDPNVYFPWKRLAENGYGLWYNDTSNVSVPDHFEVATALRIIGYDIKDETAAVLAFRRHFLQREDKGLLTAPEIKVLYVLMKQYF